MTAGGILASLIVNDAAFIKEIHEADFVVPPAKISHKWRLRIDAKPLLNTVRAAQSRISDQPDIDFPHHHHIPSIPDKEILLHRVPMCFRSPLIAE